MLTALLLSSCAGKDRWHGRLPDALAGLRRRRHRRPPQAGAREAVSALTLAADTAIRAQTQRYFCALVLLSILEVLWEPLDSLSPCELSV
jgi:hypothetical protein